MAGCCTSFSIDTTTRGLARTAGLLYTERKEFERDDLSRAFC